MFLRLSNTNTGTLAVCFRALYTEIHSPVYDLTLMILP